MVEQRSPKPRAVSSRLTTPATNLRSSRSGGFVFAQTYSPSHRCAMPAPSGMGPLCPCKEAPLWKELAANAVSRPRKSAFFIFFAAFLFFPLDKPPIFRYNRARSGGKRRTNLSDHGPVAQLVRAPACHAGGRRFEPDPGRCCFSGSSLYASVAQSVEQGTENPRVIGSIPIGGTSQETQQGFQYAAVAHLVERHLAKVEVASSSLVGRSNMKPSFVQRCTTMAFFNINCIKC